MSRLPALPLRDFGREPNLPIEPVERRLRIRDHRLHLHHEQRPAARVKREDVDRAAFAPDRERHLDLHDPTETSKAADDQLDDTRMALVHQAVELFASPAHPDVEIGPECGGGSNQGANRDAVDPPAIDQGDLGSREACILRHICLTTLEADPQRTELAAKSESIHSAMVTSGSSLALIWRLTAHVSHQIRSSASQGVGIHPSAAHARRLQVNGLPGCHLIAIQAVGPLVSGRLSPCAVLAVI